MKEVDPTASPTQPDPFEEDDKMLSQPQHRSRENNKRSVEQSERDRNMSEKATTELSRTGIREKFQSRASIEPDTSGDSRTKKRSSVAKQCKNALLSRINPREKGSSANPKRIFIVKHEESLAENQSKGFLLGFVSFGLVSSDIDFFLGPRQYKTKKRCPPRQ